VTTDDRSTSADGLASGGNGDRQLDCSEWLVVHGPSGMTFTNLPDDNVLAGVSFQARQSTMWAP
jgi:hypothetical protein